MKKCLFFGCSLIISFFSFQAFATCPSNHWELIFRHDVGSGDLFVDNTGALATNTGAIPNTVKKYSRLRAIEQYRQSDGTLIFKLSYPDLGIINTRSQTSNPTTQATVVGYTPLDIRTTSHSWGGLQYNGNYTLMDGSSIAPHPEYRYYAIGSQRFRGGSNTIPGPSSPIDLVELYVCNPYPQASIVYDHTTPTHQDVTATISIATGNGIDNCVVTNNTGSDTFLFTGDGSFTFAYACNDRFFNTVTGSATAIVTGIDKIAPTATIHYRFTLPTSGTVGVSLTGFSEPLTITNNSGSDYYEFTGNGTFTFEFIDTAGNTGSATAVVNNIRPEYSIEQSYRHAKTVNATDIDQWTRIFTGTDPKQCIYRNLRVSMGSSSYIYIPAWTCRRADVALMDAELNVANIQREAPDSYSFLFDNLNHHVKFDKPIKLQFRKTLLEGGSFPELYYKTGFLDTRQIANTYYSTCHDGQASISNTRLATYGNNYIAYTCQGGSFVLDYTPAVPDPTPVVNNYDNSDNSDSSSYYSATSHSADETITDSYNTTNNYYTDTGLVGDLLSGMTKLILDREVQLYHDINSPTDAPKDPDATIQKLVKVDSVDQINGDDLQKDILRQARLEGLRIDRAILSAYIYGRKKGILTNKYYEERDLLQPLDRKTLAIMLDRFGDNVLGLAYQSYNCNFPDISSLDFNTQQHILSACKYGFVGYTDQTEGVLQGFRPYERVTRDQLINIIARTLKVDEHNKDLVKQVISDKGILSFLGQRIENKFTVLVVMQKLEHLFDRLDNEYISKLEAKYPATPDTDLFDKKNTDYHKQSAPGGSNDSSISVRYFFGIPYKLGYKGAGVAKLQEVLKQYGTFTGIIDSYFLESTLEALYQFQLQEGLLTADSPEILHGYMGPTTRKRLNELVK